MKITILHQYVPPNAPLEELDTLAQVEAVQKALKSNGHKTQVLSCTEDLRSTIKQIKKWKTDLVFNLFEGFNISRILVPVALNSHQIPYTGSGVNALFFDAHKLYAKKLMRFAGIPTPDWFDPDTRGRPQGQFILKSISEDGSLGIDENSIISIQNRVELRRKLQAKKRKYGGNWFAEKYIQGREFQVSILTINNKPVVLPTAELIFHHNENNIYDYRAKWEDPSTEYRSFLSEEGNQRLIKKLQRIALKCWHLFELKGYARVDFRVDKKKQPYVLEFNANPCLSVHDDIVAAAKEVEIEYPQLIEYLVKSAAYEKQ